MSRATLALGLAALLIAPPSLAQQQVSEGTGAVLRGLDKISGVLSDLEIASGDSRVYGKLLVSVEDCRFPSGNPAGNAFAHVTIRDTIPADKPVLFAGWMVAGSPALNALDHPRYDVWVLRCLTP
ncbi:MAG: DUF2155 domain-containing protein [Rubellimicrobium sp.]|nr:DUF2155 domain-containing protein [Rubellimicrobium sp.]